MRRKKQREQLREIKSLEEYIDALNRDLRDDINALAFSLSETWKIQDDTINHLLSRVENLERRLAGATEALSQDTTKRPDEVIFPSQEPAWLHRGQYES